MSKFFISIDIMPHKELLDPQGKTVQAHLPDVGLKQVENVRIGKHIEFHLEAKDAQQAEAQANEACQKLLANVIMESYRVEVSPI